MMSEKEKMLAGEMYDATTPELVADRREARILFQRFNFSSENEIELRAKLLKQLIPKSGSDLWIEPPFYCDYGYNITTGTKVFFNFNCVVLDVMPVTIGSNVLFGPAVQIYTATHPLDPVERATGKEYAKPVTIGDDVWIGGGAIINPGVTIGSGTTIGSGSVVTQDIPEGVFAAGNPCRVIRQLS